MFSTQQTYSLSQSVTQKCPFLKRRSVKNLEMISRKISENESKFAKVSQCALKMVAFLSNFG